MTNEKFDEIVNDTINGIKKMLLVKSKEYQRNNDVFHNFREGAKRTGLSPEKVLDGFLLKHEISIADMTNDLDKGILPTIEKINEKFLDNIVYLLLKKAMIVDRLKNNTAEPKKQFVPEIRLL